MYLVCYIWYLVLGNEDYAGDQDKEHSDNFFVADQLLWNVVLIVAGSYIMDDMVMIATLSASNS